MSESDFERIEGSGNVFHDFGDLFADLKQAKAVLGGRVIALLNKHGFSIRKTANFTGFAAADFSRSPRKSDCASLIRPTFSPHLRGQAASALTAP